VDYLTVKFEDALNVACRPVAITLINSCHSHVKRIYETVKFYDLEHSILRPFVGHMGGLHLYDNSKRQKVIVYFLNCRKQEKILKN